MFLLDTKVISELRKAKPHGAVLAWMQSHKSAQKYLNAMTRNTADFKAFGEALVNPFKV